MALLRVNCLEEDEFRIDCLVRSIDPTEEQAAIKLNDLLTREGNNLATRPTVCHVSKEQKDLEIKCCIDRSKDLLREGKNYSENTPNPILFTALARALHFNDRIYRLKQSFRNPPEVESTIGHLRRYIQLLERFMEIEVEDVGNEDEEYGAKAIETVIPSSTVPITTINTLALQPAVTTPTTSYVEPILMSMPSSISITKPLEQKPSDYETIGSHSRMEKIPESVLSNEPLKIGGQLGFGPIGRPAVSQTAYGGHPLSSMYPPTSQFDKSTNFSFSHYSKAYVPDNSEPKDRSISHKVFPDMFIKHIKWNVPKFKDFTPTSRAGNGLNIRDFIFQIENMAMLNCFPVEELHRVIFNYIEGAAQTWLLIFLRKFPGANWSDIKDAFISRFSDPGGDEEERLLLQQKQQGALPIDDFVLEMESMNYRLQIPFSEEQLLRIIKTNLNPAIKTHILGYPFFNIESLRKHCKSLEMLWTQSGYDPRKFGDINRRRYPQINEISVDNEPYGLASIKRPHETYLETSVSPDWEENISAVQRISIAKPDTNPICWNCRDIGHLFKDCNRIVDRLFCFGCGKDGVIKPACVTCQSRSKSLNQRPSASTPGTSHSGTKYVPRTTTTNDRR